MSLEYMVRAKKVYANEKVTLEIIEKAGCVRPTGSLVRTSLTYNKKRLQRNHHGTFSEVNYGK